MGKKDNLNTRWGKLISVLQRLSFRTGVIVMSLCVPFYILSFAQMALPISVGLKSALWVILFGLAKCFQYVGLTIIGAEGLKRLKAWFRRKKESAAETDIN